MARGSLDQPAFLELLDLIYAAALDGRRWPEALDALAEAYGGSGVLWSQTAADARVGLMEFARFDPAAIRSYAGHYAATNLFLSRSRNLPDGTLITDEILDEGAYRRSEWLNDWMKPNGYYRAIGLILENSAGATTQVSVLRSAAAGRFAEAEQAQFAALGQHVGRAIQMRRRLFVADTEAASAENLLSRAGLGVLLADAIGRILFANEAALRRLGPGDGLAVSQGRLSAADGAADRRLRRLLFQAARTAAGRGAGAGGVVAVRREGKPPLSLLVCPFRGQGLAGGAPAALLFIHAPEDAPAAPERALAALWGLTPTEGRLVAALVGGQELSGWAEANGVTVATARSHLGRVFRKAEAGSQSELVRLALASPAVAWSVAHEPA